MQMTTYSPSAEASLYHSEGRKGFFSVLVNERQHTYPLSQLSTVMESLPTDKEEVFLSQQEFGRPNRRLVSLARLVVDYVDLDTYKSPYADLTPEQQVRALLLYCGDRGIPTPSLINDSGRGLHPKWLLASPIPAQALPRWNRVQSVLNEALTPFSPDRGARNASMCLRSVGSRNPRSSPGQVCRTIWVDEHNGEPARWDFDTLARELLPVERSVIESRRCEREAKSTRKQKTAGEKKVRNGWSAATLWWNRLTDVRKLIELRGWHDGVPVGSRNNFLLVCAIAVSWGAGVQGDDLFAEVEELAREFVPSLRPSEVRSTITSVLRQAQADRRLRLTDERLIEFLEVEQNEVKYLRTIIGSSERLERHRRACRERNRKESDRATYEVAAALRREQAQRIRSEGLSRSQIADRMGITVRAVDGLLRRG